MCSRLLYTGMKEIGDGCFYPGGSLDVCYDILMLAIALRFQSFKTMYKNALMLRMEESLNVLKSV